VIGSAFNYDTYLEELADALSMAMVSVEYRLAPEHPFPAAHHDCLDAALFALSPTGESQLGGPVKIIGGESAGGCLTVWVALALRDQHGIDVRSRINALVPTYGMFDMSITPSAWNHKRRAVLGKTEIFRFIEAAFGNCHFGDRKSAQVSPLYATLEGMPPALFMVGTEDPLYDDTVFMANRWHLSGNETKLMIWEGVAHAFTLFPMGDVTTEGKEELISFAKSNLK
jgi:acetyl esterase/lipase